MIELNVDTKTPTRLDRFIKRIYPSLTQSVLEKSLRLGSIRVNGNKATSSLRVTAPDTIMISEELELAKIDKKSNIFPENVKNLASKLLNEYLVFEDENLIVVNKPSGLATQSGTKIKICIDDAIAYLNSAGAGYRLVHRIDRDTSGLLLIAKNLDAASILTKSFKDKKIEKIYLGVTNGYPAESEGTLSDVIAKTRVGALEIVREDKDGLNGKLAITSYKVLKKEGGFALVEFRPVTGRMHQIRFHAKKMKTVLVGDKKYGTTELMHPNLMLHAYVVTIPKEIFGKKLTFNAPLPEYFKIKLY